MKIKIAVLLMLCLLIGSVFLTSLPQEVNAQVNEVDVEKIIDPTQVNEGEDIEITIRLTGEGREYRGPVDVVLVLDRSGSMTGDKIADAKVAASAFVDLNDNQDKVGLVSFSDTIRVDVDLLPMNSTNKILIKEEIDDLRARGETNIYGAITTANSLLLASPRPAAPLVVVLLTDGRHNRPTALVDADFEDLANDMVDDGIIAYTIGLGSDVNGERLRNFAEITSGQYFFAPNSDDLADIFREIALLLSFSGLEVTVTETIPSYLSYNDDASIEPDENNIVGDERELVWDVGTLKVGDEWEVTYTAEAEEAVEESDAVVQLVVTYIDNDASTVTLNVEPGLVFNDIAVILIEAKPNKVEQGEIIDLTGRVESQGNIRISFDVEFGIPDSTTLNTQRVTLDPGQARNVTFAWNTSAFEPETYVVRFMIDPDEDIWEEDRSDNEATTEIEITPRIAVNFNALLLLILLIMMLLLIGGAAEVQRRRQALYPTSPR